MFAAIGGFFTALPQLLNMIQSFMGWLNRVSGNDPVGHLLKIGETFKQLQDAKSDEDYAHSAKALANLISNSPR